MRTFVRQEVQYGPERSACGEAPDGTWAVKKENAQRASSVHGTQQEAFEKARETQQNSRGGGRCEVLIHGEDGKIRDARSYGNDPNPPKDKR